MSINISLALIKLILRYIDMYFDVVMIRVWNGGSDPTFRLLFGKNPTSHFLFISISRIPCPILANPAFQEQSNAESHSIF